jgi:uncharacterized protein (TIGR04255 family)
MSNTRSLSEVIFVAHFAATKPLTVLDLADWYNGLAENYPVFQQQPPWPPFIWHDFGAAAAGHPVVPQFFRTPDFVPRISGISEDQRWTIHCQSDRVAFSWRRLEPTGELTPYPGFESVFKDSIAFLEGFRAWWLRRFDIPVAFQICELNYFNAFPFTFETHSLRVSDIFKFGVPRPGQRIGNLNVSWIVPEEPPHHVRVQCIAAMGATADCSSAAIFNFAGSSKVERGGSPDELHSIYEDLHAAVTSAYISNINFETIGAQE